VGVYNSRMTRGEFLTAIAGAAIAVKAVAHTELDGSVPKQKRLLVIEVKSPASQQALTGLKEALRPYEQRYGVEFLIFEEGLRIVDPAAPRTPSVPVDITYTSGDVEYVERRSFRPDEIAQLVRPRQRSNSFGLAARFLENS
jgi:hypothetical protein